MPRLPAPEDYGLSAPRPSRDLTAVAPAREAYARLLFELAHLPGMALTQPEAAAKSEL